MAQSSNKIEVYLEIGKNRTFAGATDWPGWCRVGRDDAAALQALFDYGTRYAHILQAAQIKFQPSAAVSEFAVVERLEGSTTTDFGAPDIAPSSDTKPVDEAELRRLQTLLQAHWQAFDTAVRAASGKELRKGPRGGGRDLAGIVRHVLGAEASYLARLAWKFKPGGGPGRRTRSDPAGGARCAGSGGAWQVTCAWTTRWRHLDAALLRPPGGLARARSPVGD